MRKLVASIAVAVCCAAITAGAAGQTASPPPVPGPTRGDTDPTNPVFISIRPEFYAVDDRVEQRLLVFRYDARVLQRQARFPGGVPGLILRFEAPMAGADANGASAGGLGDAYAQVLVLWRFRRSIFFVKVQLGRMLGSNVGVWVKPEIFWGPNRDGLWNIKTGIVSYERRAARAAA